MRRPDILLLPALALMLGAAAAPVRFGTPLTPAELAGRYAVPPDGTGLPPGSGSVAAGAAVFAQACAACHGDHLQGQKEIGAPPLVGGRSTLASAKPLKTVESYWPYATTLFDYIRRAMPMNAPGSLTPDQVYAVCAYILAQGRIVTQDAVRDARTLPAVRMPNRGGFTSTVRTVGEGAK